ncbi:MAG: diguanylate cyclase [Pseudomonadota bacterium]
MASPKTPKNTLTEEKSSSPRESIAYRDVDSQMGEFARTVELNERILQRLQSYELMLLDAVSLAALLDVLLDTTPSHFGLNGVSLSLYDPNGEIKELLDDGGEFGVDLSLQRDSFDMQQLYGARPQVELIVSEDPRALRAIANVESGQSAILLPLVRDDLLVGSFHWVSEEANAFNSETELDFINHLAAIIAICLENCVNAERLSQLSLLDPLTRLSNARAFEMELRKEVARAHRNNKPLTLMMLEVDDYQTIADNYGHLSSDFTVRSVGQAIGRTLRRTDLLARLEGAHYALLLPACAEAKGQEIGERMRSDTEFMEIDDGRGANLFASLSIGLTCWSPQNYPAINMEQLAEQIKHNAVQALQRSREQGGNRVSLLRLAPVLT